MPATHYTDTGLQIHQALSGSDSVKLTGSQYCGDILMARGKYAVASSIAQGDVIRITRLPKGAVVVPHLCRAETEALGSSFSVKIGDSSSDSRYADAVALSQAASQPFTPGAGALSPTPLEKADWITATIATLNAPALGKKVMFWIAYIMP